MEKSEQQGRGRVIAVCGKGGVGKTSVCAILTGQLVAGRHGRALVIDADHAGGLCMALGLTPARTLEDVRQAALTEAKEEAVSRADLARSADYQLLDALEELGSVAFLALGRPRTRGCFCAVNKALRQAITQLAGQFDLVLVDGEAGVEQVNRDVAGVIDYLLLVSDTSAKGLRVAEAVQDVTRRNDRLVRRGLLLNRVQDPGEADAVAGRTALPLLGAVPEDAQVRRWDAEERSFLDLPPSPAREAVRRALDEILAG